jgi:hypothetical protein
MGEPPLFVGAVHDRLICDDEDAVAASPVGGCDTTADVVADAVLDGELVPIALNADTR